MKLSSNDCFALCRSSLLYLQEHESANIGAGLMLAGSACEHRSKCGGRGSGLNTNHAAIER